MVCVNWWHNKGNLRPDDEMLLASNLIPFILRQTWTTAIIRAIYLIVFEIFNLKKSTNVNLSGARNKTWRSLKSESTSQAHWLTCCIFYFLFFLCSNMDWKQPSAVLWNVEVLNCVDGYQWLPKMKYETQTLAFYAQNKWDAACWKSCRVLISKHFYTLVCQGC